ncbi:S9 family peptidase [Bryobacter aggregatus]|uniref:S9 family peptidase n=1 Tax=Bryobacter aggregatus TaxID=360054 RepID=UPI00068D5FB1|nr:S9 family peptidase [Bryobacter aggregatus]
MTLRRTLFLSLLVSLSLLAQKKPITLDTLKQRPTATALFAPIWAPNGSEFAYLRNGGLHLYDCRTKQSRPLFARLSDLTAMAVKDSRPEGAFGWQNRRVTEQHVQWAPDSSALLIAEGGDLFWITAKDGTVKQLTKTEAVEADAKLSPNGKRVSYRIENDLYFQDIASGKVTRLTRDGSETLLNGKLNWVYPEELDLNTAYWWSPDSARIAYLQFDISKEMIYPQADLLKIPAVAEPQRYPQAGTPNADVRLGVVDLETVKSRWMDLGETRDHLLARVDWLNPSEVSVQRMSRVQDKLEFLAANWETRQVRKAFGETDPYWINVNSMTRLNPERKEILWASEKSGTRHLYLLGYEGKELGQLTKGDWEVTSVAGVNWEKKLVYYTSTEVSPLERHLYVIGFDGKNKRKLTTEPGTHIISMSPAAGFYTDTYSSITVPTRQTLHASDGSNLEELKPSDRTSIDEYDILPTEFLHFKTKDGATLDARLIKPKNFDPRKKYPAIVMVYGGPHAQSVRNAWTTAANLDQVLAHKGFVIWQVDNRGSAGRGHLWEAKLYRKFGEIEVQDQKAGIEYLVGLGFVDSARVGMSGWSYGGYMTLNTMLSEPKLIKAGISGAPVTNWLLYDTIYTERYLGTPQENEKGYRESSPVHKAKNLEGKLLLVHNIGDDNVLFQNMLQMTDALERADKQFDLLIYPQKSHGVTGPARFHLNEAMVQFFERNLLH